MPHDFRSILETFENQYPQREYVIEIVCPEFTSVCPRTGQPDFGTLTFTYSPRLKCVELKSLKLYFQSFRNRGIFYEDVTNTIRNDLVAAMKPLWLEVITRWRGRGGIRSIICASHGDVPPGRHGAR